jgi:hypothetical protein
MNTPHPMQSDRIGNQSVLNPGGQSYRNQFTPDTARYSQRSPNHSGKSPSYNNANYSPFYMPAQGP